MTHQTVETLMSTVRELPTLPSIAARVTAVARDPDSTAHDMAAVISRDQALTANLLRVVNSAYFGFLRRIANASEAINLLGYNEVVHMTMAVSVVQQFDHASENGFDRRAFWTHSIAVATGSQLLADHIRYPHADAAFTAGLLHDVGKLILDQFFSKPFGEIMKLVREEGLSSREAEQQVLGVTHAEVGEWIARSWILPEAAITSIRHHHDDREQRSGLFNSHDDIVDIVQFADIYCRNHGFGHSGDPAHYEIPSGLQERLRLSSNDIAALHDRLAAVVHDIQAFF